MSSLSEQLERARQKGTAARDRASFLFSTKDAEHIDSETVANLAANGLAELIKFDSRFARFEAVLFSQSSRHFDRERQTSETNAAVDAHIEAFLLLLTGHFVDRSAHKTLEFLVRRYHIHRHNVDAVVRCMLPSHDSRAFGRMARILQFHSASSSTSGANTGSKWRFVGAARDSGGSSAELGLGRKALADRCLSDGSVFAAVLALARCACRGAYSDGFAKEGSAKERGRSNSGVSDGVIGGMVDKGNVDELFALDRNASAVASDQMEADESGANNLVERGHGDTISQFTSAGVSRVSTLFGALCLEILTRATTITEETLRQLVPTLILAMGAGRCAPEMHAAALAVAARMCARTDVVLGFKPQANLQLALVKSCCAGVNVSGGLLCLASLVHATESHSVDGNAKLLAHKVVTRLERLSGLGKLLTTLSQSHEVGALMRALFFILPSRLWKVNKASGAGVLLLDLVSNGPESVVADCARVLTAALVSERGQHSSVSDDDDDVVDEMDTTVADGPVAVSRQLLLALAKRFPGQTEQGLTDVLGGCKGALGKRSATNALEGDAELESDASATSAQKRLKGNEATDSASNTRAPAAAAHFAFVSRTFSLASGSIRHVPLGDTGTTLLLALNGQDPLLRCSALKEAARIFNEYKSVNTSSDDYGTIVHDLYRPVVRRLRDDDASVVCCVCSDALRPLLVRSGVRYVAEEVGRAWFVWAPRSRSQSSKSGVRVQARNVLRSLLGVMTVLAKSDKYVEDDSAGVRQILPSILFDALPQPHSEHGVRLIHRDAVRCAARIGCGLFAAFDEIEMKLDATNKTVKSKTKAKLSKPGSMSAAELGELAVNVMAENVVADAETRNNDGALDQLVAIASDRSRWHSRQLALRVLVGALNAGKNHDVSEAPNSLVTALRNELREEWASLETMGCSFADNRPHITFLGTAWACTIRHLSSPKTVEMDSQEDFGEGDGKALELARAFPVLDSTCVELLAVLLSTPTTLQAAAQVHVCTMCTTLLQSRPLPALAIIYGQPLKGAGIHPRAASRGLLLTATAIRAAKDNPPPALARDVESVIPVLLATLPHRDVANRRAVLACFRAVSDFTAAAILPGDITYLAKNLVSSTNMLLTNQGNSKRCVSSMLMPPSSEDAEEEDASRAARESLQLRLVSAVSAHLESWEGLALRLLNLVQAAAWEPAVRDTSARLLARLLRNFQDHGRTLPPSHYKVVKILLQNFSWCGNSPSSVFNTGLLALSCGWASNDDTPSVPSPQALALKRLNTQSVAALVPERQDAVVSALLHELGTANHDIAIAVHTVLRSLPADGIVSTVSSQLQSCLDEGDAYANEKAMLSDAGVGWIQKQAALLEILQFGDMTGMSAETRETLFGTLFRLLEAFTVPARSMAVGIEFAKQLVLGAFERYILAISADGAVASQSTKAQSKHQKKRRSKKKPEKVTGSAEAQSVSLVVTIARETANPQTRSAALVVLSLVAKCWPQHVLCTLRPIFSCIGDVISGDSSVFAFNVIHQILKTMIPPIRDLEKDSKGTQLQEFVQEMLSSLQQVPSERRLNLMSNLVEAILPTSLNAVIFLLLQQHHADRSGRTKDVDRFDAFDRQAFAHALTLRFGARVQVFVLARLVNDAMVLLRHAVPAADDDEIPPIDEEVRPAVQLQMADQCAGVKEAFSLCTQLLQFVTEHIASQQFHFKLLSLSEFKQEELQEEYLELFQGVLLFVECTAQRQGDSTELLPNAWRQQVSDERRRSWLAQCQRASLEVLENVQRLLSMPAFVTMLQQLMESDNQHVRNKAMMLLNDKVTKQRDELNHVEQRLLVDMVSDLQPLLRKQSTSDEMASAVDVQTVLVCIDTLARAFASNFTDVFEPVIPDVLHIVAGSSFEDDPQVLSCCLFCLTALCSKISASMVPHLPRLVPRALETLEWCLNVQSELQAEESQAAMALQTSALSFVEVVLDKLPHFLHPSVQRIAFYLCSPDMLRSSNKAVRALATQVGFSLASRTEPRITVPALLQCSSQFLDNAQADVYGGKCQRKALELLEQTIIAMKPLDVERYHGELFDHFLCIMNDPSLFDAGAAEDGADAAHNAEEAALVFSASFMSLVMRLNEAQLRPLFSKMCDWETADSDRRSAPFFFVVKLLVSRLKSIFVPFFASIMGRCVAVLAPQTHVQHRLLVVRWVLQALKQCFLHDSDGFTTDERFQMLEPVLLGQIEHADTSLRDETKYKAFVEDVLSPCVVQLAIAVNNEQAWRQLNRNVLMKTRKPTPAVRYAALRITQELFKTLGEDFMLMLPESIPFLSELMEDESEDVEALCQQLMKELEEISGEKLDEYLE